MDRPITRPGELVSRDTGVRMAGLRVGGYLDLRPPGFTFGGCGNSESAGFFFSFKWSTLQEYICGPEIAGQERIRM